MCKCHPRQPIRPMRWLDAAYLPRAARTVFLCWLAVLCMGVLCMGGPSIARANATQLQIDAKARQQQPTPVRAQNQKGLASISIPDEELIDQDNGKVRFYSELIKDKVVVVSFVFTSCGYLCPLQGATLAKLQAALGERFGRDVYFVSVSIDPETDSAKRLKDWADRFGASAGWTLVTGEKTRIDNVVRAFTGGAAAKGEHSAAIFIGNEREGSWIRVYGLAGVDRLTTFIDQVMRLSSTGS